MSQLISLVNDQLVLYPGGCLIFPREAPLDIHFFSNPVEFHYLKSILAHDSHVSWIATNGDVSDVLEIHVKGVGLLDYKTVVLQTDLFKYAIFQTAESFNFEI